MYKKTTLLDEKESYQQAESPACFSRFGTITEIYKANGAVKVDFEGNVLGQPIMARLGRSFTLSELTMAVDNQLNCRVEFIGADLTLPVITDIFFSILDESEELTIRANKLVLETKSELVLRSGETETRYSGRDGRVTTKGRFITTQADKANKIQGGTVSIN
ncbi:hypothetical protein KP803_09730 [Vibrio sp. ZSDE26]|uniref:Uncharacterized protein n=1 Tax=Vibrio amylolyticus TaxID=2847292 RepID=A0A9X1XK07_9VIBR|nr:hypothetical protein [Vibrio amylolyticus]MCK6263550.1 hypothetical protein [Vibrio amylolyticus]